jgi:hypothetical protein
MATEKDEVRRRVCRACNESYAYPVAKGLATRFHCASCSQLAPEVRATFERYNRRIKTLAAAVAKLEQQCQAPDGGPANAKS